MIKFDLTPDPKVLVALTHTPLQPLDALCELIDNSLDSFEAARIQGRAVSHPLVLIDLPGRPEVDRKEGVVRIRDNGPGMTPEQAEKALTAGYSGKNPYDSLGLFGMGFNIATGKIGSVTRFLTGRVEDINCLETVVDLVAMQEAGNYEVPVQSVSKPSEFTHGTIVEVRGWWPEGNPNNGFIRKLASYARPAIRREIGRRYATILRSGAIRILLNGEACEGHEHCAWDDSRFVERRTHGQIPAVFRLDKVLGSQKRCSRCTARISSTSAECAVCGSSSFRTIEERVRGWLGIQRFDDLAAYGIDLIRNGRAIRVDEKNAFFEFTDEFKKTTKDYPVDGQYGRIVGEVHLDHVPVDFLKQDFQRSTEEWQRAIEYLRGASSLQPNQPNADQNQSPIYKLFQGYRRVRTAGKTDMYMGYWDPDANHGKGGPKRISRDIELDYLQKFEERLPGYRDDAEWWKLVEQADQQPLANLVECPECGGQNLEAQESCTACGAILKGKECVNPACKEIIATSSLSCEHCGHSQVPDIQHPWRCEVCGGANTAADDKCRTCDRPAGTPDPFSREYLFSNSDKDDELSLPHFSIELPDGSFSQPLQIEVMVARQPLAKWDRPPVPILIFKGEKVEIFLDKGHSVFKTFGVRPEILLAEEIGQFIYESNRRVLATQFVSSQTISNLTWNILQAAWGSSLAESAEGLRSEIQALFDLVKKRLAGSLGEAAEEVFGELTDSQKSAVVSKLLARGGDIGRIADLRDSGDFALLVDDETVVALFRRFPQRFFDGAVWQVPYVSIDGLPDAVLAEAQSLLRARHLNCLEDIFAFQKNPSSESLTLLRARASLDLLSMRMD